MNAWHELPSDDLSWSSGHTLSLITGAMYTVQIGAVNGAGLTAVRMTNGVIVDVTKPQVIKKSLLKFCFALYA